MMSPGLARSGIRGAWFSGSSTLVTSTVQAVKLVVLARLLTPEDFGVAGMAMVLIACGSLIADLGVGAAVIQRENVPEPVLSRLYGLGLATGAGLFVILCVGAPLASRIYGEPRVAPVLIGLGATFLVLPIGALHQAFAEKRLAFKRLAAIEVAASIAGATGAILCALVGGGVWALVLDPVAAGSVKAALLSAQARAGWRGRPSFGVHGLRPYLRFGALSVGQRAANYATANVDYALVGFLLGAHALGLYRIAYELATLTSGRLNVVVSRVFFPVMTRFAADRERFRGAFLRMQETATLLGAPLVIGIGLVAPLAVPGLLGARWTESVPLLRVLCVVGLGRVIAGTIGPAILAAGRPELGLRWSLTLVAIQVPAIALAVTRGGLSAVAWTFAALQTAYVVLNYRLLVRTLFGPCLRAYLATILPALAFGCVMAGAVAAVGWATRDDPWPLALGLAVATGATVYAGLVFVFRRRVVEDLAMIPPAGGPASA
jgi:O-antigen/teichoic acid export membrane protein